MPCVTCACVCVCVCVCVCACVRACARVRLCVRVGWSLLTMCYVVNSTPCWPGEMSPLKRRPHMSQCALTQQRQAYIFRGVDLQCGNFISLTWVSCTDSAAPVAPRCPPTLLTPRCRYRVKAFFLFFPFRHVESRDRRRFVEFWVKPALVVQK